MIVSARTSFPLHKPRHLIFKKRGITKSTKRDTKDTKLFVFFVPALCPS